MAGGYKPRWVVTVTPVGGSATDVSAYVTKIDVTASLAIKTSQFEVDLWDRDGRGFMAAFGPGSVVDIWADTIESASANAATVDLVANTPALVPVKAWSAVQNPPAGLQTRASLDGTTWGPWLPLGAGNVPQTPAMRYVEASAACTIAYQAMPKVMSGIVLNPIGGHNGPNQVTVKLRGDDWTVVLLNRKVSGKFYVGDGITNGAPDLIIKQIVSNFFPELTTNNVQSGAPALSYELARRKTAFTIMNDLSLATGWIWWVDTSKDVHWQPVSGTVHPVALSWGTTIVRGTMMGPEYDATKLVNRVTLWGGSVAASQSWVDAFVGNGSQRQWPTTYPVEDDAPLVTVNGVVQTVAQDNSGQTAQWYYTYGGSYFRQDPSQPAIGGSDQVYATYAYTTPLIQQLSDAASIADYGVFEQDVVDSSVTTQTVAQAKMMAAIQGWSRPILRVQCDSWETSYAPGDSVEINDPALGLNAEILTMLECHHQITPEQYQLTVIAGNVQGGGTVIY